MTDLRLKYFKVLLALTGLCSCSENPFVNSCTVRTVVNDAVVPIILLDHQQATVKMNLPPPFACPNGNPIAKTVVTEIFDSMNHSVEHTATSPTTDDSSGYTTHVTFTPSVPGSYYLSARFEPSIGAQHRDVSVAEDHTGDQPFISNVAVPAGCVPMVITDVLVLCRVETTVAVVRPAENKVSIIEGVFFAAYAQPSLWVWGGASLTRFEDTGSGAFVARENLLLSSSASQTSNAVPGPSTLILFTSNSIDTYVAANGALTRQTTPFSGVPHAESGRAVSLGNNQYGVSNDFTLKTLCQVSLASNPPTSACAPAGSETLIPEGAGFWANEVDRTVRYAFANGLPTSSTLPYIYTGRPQSRAAAPTFELSTSYLSLRAPDFRLDAFPKPSPSTDWRSGSLRDLFWEINVVTHQLTAYRRPDPL